MYCLVYWVVYLIFLLVTATLHAIFRDFELEVQSTLLLYLGVVLTSWTQGFYERGQAILALLQEESGCIDLLLRLLARKVAACSSLPFSSNVQSSRTVSSGRASCLLTARIILLSCYHCSFDNWL